MYRYTRFALCFVSGMCLLAVSTVTQSLAQTTTDLAAKKTARPQVNAKAEAAIQIKRKQLFTHMLSQPDDLDTAFQYATLSIQVGDLEAAISTLERMLIFSPGLPRLQLELGLLYYRLSAYTTAQTYFEAAISGENVPEEVRAKVNQYLTGIVQAGKLTTYSAQTRVGVRYQTNANRGPNGEIIILNGLPFELNANSQATADGNAYTSGKFHVSRKLPQQGTSLEFDLVSYGSKQFELEQFDLAQAEMTLGPAFDLGRFGIDNAALGVYGIAAGAFLHEDFYASFFGAGTRVVSRPHARLSTSTKLEYRYKTFYNSPTVPSASDRDGHEIRFLSSGQYLINQTRALNYSAGITRSLASADYLSFTSYGAQIGSNVAFDSPFKDKQKWVFGTSVGVLYKQYDDPDPIVNVSESQEDMEYIAQASLNIPLKNKLSVLGEVDYRYVDSNYTTREHNNFGTTLSLVKIW